MGCTCVQLYNSLSSAYVHIYVCLQYTYILNVLNLEDFEYYYYYNQI